MGNGRISATGTAALSTALFIGFVSVGVLLGKSSLDFAWKMIIAVAMIVFGYQMITFKLPGSQTTNWPNYVKFYGWTTLMVVLLFSNIGGRGRDILNKIDEGATVARVYRCPDDIVTMPALNQGHVLISMSKGCKFEVDYSRFVPGIWTWADFENGKKYTTKIGQNVVNLTTNDFINYGQARWKVVKAKDGSSSRIWAQEVSSIDKTFDIVGEDTIHVVFTTITEAEGQRRMQGAAPAADNTLTELAPPVLEAERAVPAGPLPKDLLEDGIY